MLKSKRNLIKRLKDEIVWEQEHAEEKIAKIQSRIRIAESIAESLADALERGTLKP